ncbi:MAG TPA: cupin domain-containing protein [Gammaproteobacteria bacterium]|nr:cupin domain-containing protein [Gammaproteobacteria bacterium]
MPRGSSPLLGGQTPAGFLKRHWQKKPLLIRDAFPGFRSPLGPRELAGLACEDGVESRLVLQTRRAPGWQLRHGPFKRRDFLHLPKRRWTLLVQDVDKHVPAVAELLTPFRFIPDWRIDDLMISYAADGGSVGPHVDSYDVFLLQAEGLRRWDVSSRPHAPAEAAGLELRQVQDFVPEESWLLFPGDMLYLPPGVVHHGVALGPGMTCSIGFRAPSVAELLADHAGHLLERRPGQRRYTDPDLTPAGKRGGELDARTRTRLRHLLQTELQSTGSDLDIGFGRYLTEIKPWLQPSPPRRACNPAEIGRRLATGQSLSWHAASRTLWFKGPHAVHLFVDGSHYPVPPRLAAFARLLSAHRHFIPQKLGGYVRHPVAGPLLKGFIDRGQLTWRR